MDVWEKIHVKLMANTNCTVSTLTTYNQPRVTAIDGDMYFDIGEDKYISSSNTKFHKFCEDESRDVTGTTRKPARHKQNF